MQAISTLWEESPQPLLAHEILLFKDNKRKTKCAGLLYGITRLRANKGQSFSEASYPPPPPQAMFAPGISRRF